MMKRHKTFKDINYDKFSSKEDEDIINEVTNSVYPLEASSADYKQEFNSEYSDLDNYFGNLDFFNNMLSF